jgi:hypothetical protein
MAKYDHTQWTEMFAAVKAAWEANNVVGVDDWDPSKHTLFPKDVR